MRNPKNSWNKSDSFFDIVSTDDSPYEDEIARKWVDFLYP